MKPRQTATLLVLATALAGGVQAQDEVKIKVTPVAGSVHLLEGRGGNIAISAGDDGVFMVDDQYAPVTERIRAAVRTVSPHPIRFVINTHWHQDHTGGNENLGNAGALIVAHDQVRMRLASADIMRAVNRVVAPAALPVITFTESVTFHLNGDEIHVTHVARAHTDGDSLVHFRRANVLHMGDVYFNGLYPFIDLASGGAVDGVIAAAERGLALADRRTRIIPGHGPLSDRAGLQAYRDLLVTVRDRIAAQLRDGRSLAEIQAARPTAEFDAKWGQGFMPPERFVEQMVRGLEGS